MRRLPRSSVHAGADSSAAASAAAAAADAAAVARAIAAAAAAALESAGRGLQISCAKRSERSGFPGCCAGLISSFIWQMILIV